MTKLNLASMVKDFKESFSPIANNRVTIQKG